MATDISVSGTDSPAFCTTVSSQAVIAGYSECVVSYGTSAQEGYLVPFKVYMMDRI